MKVSPQARKKDPSLPLTWEVRAITREIDGKSRTLFTSLCDPARFKADDVFALYHERWEIELAYGEIKTDMLGQAMTLRSQHCEGVKQELWATLLMYNLIRLEITRIADEAKVEPSRISFITALQNLSNKFMISVNGYVIVIWKIPIEAHSAAHFRHVLHSAHKFRLRNNEWRYVTF